MTWDTQLLPGDKTPWQSSTSCDTGTQLNVFPESQLPWGMTTDSQIQEQKSALMNPMNTNCGGVIWENYLDACSS